MTVIDQLTQMAEENLKQSNFGIAAQTVSSLPENYTKRIFLRLGAIYGHRFISLYPTDKAKLVAKTEWGNALARLSDFQIGQALDRCRLISDWNPNIPEFLRLATNLPTLDSTIYRVLQKKVIDPVTQRIMFLIGNYDLKRKTDKEIEKAVRSLYLDVYEEMINELQGKTENWKPPLRIQKNSQKKKEETRTVEVGENAVKEAMSILENSSTQKKASIQSNKPVLEQNYNEEEILKELQDHQEKLKGTG